MGLKVLAGLGPELLLVIGQQVENFAISEVGSRLQQFLKGLGRLLSVGEGSELQLPNVLRVFTDCVFEGLAVGAVESSPDQLVFDYGSVGVVGQQEGEIFDSLLEESHDGLLLCVVEPPVVAV